MSKETKPDRSVFLITSSQEGNATHGTGFVIHRQGGRTWLLTCRHVVTDAGGGEAVLVDRKPVEKVIMKDEGPEDLAVLAVEGLADAPILRLKVGGKTKRPIQMVGFYLFDKKEARYSLSTVDGSLGKAASQEMGGTTGRADTWDLDVRGDDHLKEGYSGSPVIEVESGAVIGVVSHMLGKGEKGVAVSVDALSRVWPEAAGRLMEGAPEDTPRPSESGEKPAEREPNYGKILALLCNREDHDDTFQEQFIRFCTDDSCANAPQFYIIHGDTGEAHRSLVERFVKTHIRAYLNESRRGTGDTVVHEIKPAWVVKKDLEAQKEALGRQLINAVNRSYTDRDFSLGRLLGLPQVQKYGAVLVRYHITAGNWTAHCRELLKWYMTTYWRLDPAETEAPLFIIFFSIEYPRTEPRKGWLPFRRDRRQKEVEKIRRQLSHLVAEVGETCRCVLIDELRPVTREQAADWFRRYTAFGDYEIERRIKSIFEDEPEIPMSVLEHHLEKIASKIDQNAFQRHLEGMDL